MDEKISKKIFLIIIILLIIIVLAFLFFTSFGKIENKCLKPTGNIDIFNIDIDKNCNCDNEYPIWNEEKYKNELNKLFFDNVNDNYIYQQHLNIFNNAFYEYNDIISPGTSNTYYFVVHNSSAINVKYHFETYEKTNYDIDLKYRLKRNNKYIIGSDNSWVTSDELKTTFKELNVKKTDKYSLDWKWEHESSDDNIDNYNIDDLYKLNIRFYFKQV